MPAPGDTPRRRPRRLTIAAGLVVVAIIMLVALWDWNWFRPLVERQASAALGRQVTMRHFDLHPGRVTEAVADGLVVANPSGFAADAPLAAIERLSVKIDVMAFLRDRSIVIPEIGVDHPVVEALARPDGSNNWTLGGGGGQGGSPSSGPGPKLGELRISDGHVHAVIPKLRADFALDVATRDSAAGGQLLADAKGTYAGQPITGHFTGGKQTIRVAARACNHQRDD